MTEIRKLKQKVNELETQVAQYQNRYAFLENQLNAVSPQPVTMHPPNIDTREEAKNSRVISPPHSASANGTATRASETNHTAIYYSMEDEMRAVLQSIEKWRTAWQSQDVEAYISQYTYRFGTADGKSRKAWEEERKIKLNRPKAISIQVDNIHLNRLDLDRWEVTFRQVYQSDLYQDVVTKRLTLKKVGDQYLIDHERAVQSS